MTDNKIYFYTEDETRFISKLRALEYSKKTHQKLNFHYHDEVYSGINWTKELPGDLQYYYKQQALRLREKYDYLILTYSGGYDSTNILETFVYNNIKLDKIVVVGAFSKDSAWGVDENHNGEIYHNAIPYLKELGLMDITDVIDYTNFLDGENFKNLSIYQSGSDWVYDIGSFFSVHNWFWKDAEKIVTPERWKNKKVGFILGADKPEINQIQNEVSFSFFDPSFTQYGNSSGSENIERIPFYFDINYTDLLVKQIQELKYNKCFGSNQRKSAEFLYKLKKPLMFHSPKTGNVFWSLRDIYLKQMKDTELFKFYEAGLKKIENGIGFSSVVPIATRKYLV